MNIRSRYAENDKCNSRKICKFYCHFIKCISKRSKSNKSEKMVNDKYVYCAKLVLDKKVIDVCV